MEHQLLQSVKLGHLDPICRDVTKIQHEEFLEPNSTTGQLKEHILLMANFAEPLEKSVKVCNKNST
jgi:hypothetical protein